MAYRTFQVFKPYILFININQGNEPMINPPQLTSLFTAGEVFTSGLQLGGELQLIPGYLAPVAGDIVWRLVYKEV